MNTTQIAPVRLEDVCLDLLAGGVCVRFRATGGSMRPAIQHGDQVTVVPVDAAALLPGAIALYRRDGRLFAHRFVGVAGDCASGQSLIFRGDAATSCDGPVPASAVLGAVVAIEAAQARGRARRLLGAARRFLGASSRQVPGRAPRAAGAP